MYIKRFNENKSMDNLFGYIRVIILEDCTIYLKVEEYVDDYEEIDYEEIEFKLSKDDIIYIDILDDMGDEVYASIEVKGYDHVGTGLIEKYLFEVDIEAYKEWKNSNFGGDYKTFRDNIKKYNI